MTEVATEVRRTSPTGTILGTALVILGILALVAPLLSGLAVTVVAAVLLTAAGVTRLSWAFGAASFGRGVLTFLLGGLMILGGLVMLAAPLVGLAWLTVMLAAYFLVDGVMDIVAAIRIRPAEHWSWMLVGGLVSLLLAAVIWRQWPISGLWAVGMLVGLRLLVAGFEMIALHRLMSNVVKA